jgi:hypothetical protein
MGGTCSIGGDDVAHGQQRDRHEDDEDAQAGLVAM